MDILVLMWWPGAKIRGCYSALMKHLPADLINSSKHFTFSGVIATEISNLTGKFDKSGGTLSGDINLTDHKLNFVKGGTLGFYIYKDDSGKIGLYNHDNLLLAYFDFGGGLHMRSSIVQDIT